MELKGEEEISSIKLALKLSEYEDVETAIVVYKEANFIIKQYQKVKKAALNLAENELRINGEEHRKTAIGSCGWTQPRVKVLDEKEWTNALSQNKELKNVVIEFEQAKNKLEKVQRPFMKFPDGRFFIR